MPAESNSNDSILSSDREMEFWTKQNIFKDIECGKSLYIFSKSNCLRIYVYKIVKHRLFDQFIIFCIFINSLVLVYDTFVEEIGTSEAEDVSYFLNLFFTILFTLESFMKALGNFFYLLSIYFKAFGFVLDTNSYLRDTWS